MRPPEPPISYDDLYALTFKHYLAGAAVGLGFGLLFGWMIWG